MPGNAAEMKAFGPVLHIVWKLHEKESMVGLFRLN
jgi:hypothetical protein